MADAFGAQTVPCAWLAGHGSVPSPEVPVHDHERTASGSRSSSPRNEAILPISAGRPPFLPRARNVCAYFSFYWNIYSTADIRESIHPREREDFRLAGERSGERPLSPHPVFARIVRAQDLSYLLCKVLVAGRRLLSARCLRFPISRISTPFAWLGFHGAQLWGGRGSFKPQSRPDCRLQGGALCPLAPG